MTAWLGGDLDAGERLFARHFASVRRFFCNKVPPAEVEDLMQRTFAACIEGASQYRGESRFVTYLLAIANSQLHRWLRKRDPLRQRDLDLGAVSVRDLGMSPSTLAATRERQRQVLEALQRLPVELQTALELHYWEGLSSAEIGEIVGVPRGTVRSRLHRARGLLRIELLSLAKSARWHDLDAVDTQARAIAALIS